ncbi:hypothetical protein H6F71_22480 [Microcoleus sp. FACHB-61]|nr:hypothetical protein [Microcoleus sp. FACHB-61]
MNIDYGYTGATWSLGTFVMYFQRDNYRFKHFTRDRIAAWAYTHIFDSVIS